MRVDSRKGDAVETIRLVLVVNRHESVVEGVSLQTLDRLLEFSRKSLCHVGPEDPADRDVVHCLSR